MEQKGERRQLAFLLFITLTLPLLSSINFPYGINEDLDGYLILRRALSFSNEGYIPSRTWGYPLYELFAYPLIYYFGVNSVKLYSLFWSLISALVFFRILSLLTNNFSRVVLGTLCFVLHPLTIIASNLVMETSQAMALGLLGLFFWAKLKSNLSKDLNVYLTFLFCGLATATRLEYSILTLTIALSLLAFHSFTKKQIVLSLMIYLVFAFAPYFSLYEIKDMDPFPFMPIFDQSYLRKGVRVLIEMTALLGIPTVFYLIFFSKKLFRKTVFQKLEVNVLFFSSLVLYTLFFLQEPIKLEYIYILIPLFIIFAVVHFQNSLSLGVLLITLVIPNCFQVHFFYREAGKIKIDIGISLGAVMQDRHHRLRNEYVMTKMDEILKLAAEKFGCKDFTTGLTRSLAEVMANPGQCYIIQEEKLRFWNADRLPNGDGDREILFKNSKVIVYPTEYNKGWRQFFRFKRWEVLNLDDFHLVDSSWGRSPNN